MSGVCGAPFKQGTIVSLTATAPSGSVFAGWSGDCSGTGSCAVTMDRARSVTATFTTVTSQYTLSVLKSGAGSGTVTSAPSGINCGATCSVQFSSGTYVILTATAPSGSVFAGWSGDCFGTGSCAVTMDRTRSATATFNTVTSQYTLSVQKSGAGTGTVTSSPSGINCGATCGAQFSSGTYVVLTATAPSGSVFAGWSGDCSGTGSCAVTMDRARAVSATFSTVTSTSFTLAVGKSGNGVGSVTSTPSGIECSWTCGLMFADFGNGTEVRLIASPWPSGSLFAGWSGDCSGTGSCAVTMDRARSVTATFTTVTSQYTLSVLKSGAGSGTVTSAPSGINCGATCSAPFSSGTYVSLTATSPSESVSAGWSGDCSGTGSCVVTMDRARSVTATFNPVTSQYTLSVQKSGAGSGTVTSAPSGINCGATCSVQFSSGTYVILTATAPSGSVFAGWSGDCSGTGSCAVTMDRARSVTGTFNTVTSQYTLSVLKSGAATGTVTSLPSGINCGSTCSAQFSSGTYVVLTATTSSGSVFAGWSGDCSGTGSCAVTMDRARSVTATFNTVTSQYTLSVQKSGAGTGTVTSSPSGISCGSACSAQFSRGTDVTLTATPAIASRFNGWGAICSGQGSCLITMTAPRSVFPDFGACSGVDALGPGNDVRTSSFFGSECLIEGRPYRPFRLSGAGASPYAVVRGRDFTPGLDLWREPSTFLRSARVGDFSQAWPNARATALSLSGASASSWLLVRRESSTNGSFDVAVSDCGTLITASNSGANATQGSITSSNSCLLSGGNRLRVHFFALDNSWTGFGDDIRIVVQTIGFTGKICLYKYPFGGSEELECDTYLTGGLTIDFDLGGNPAAIYALYVFTDVSSQSKTGTYSITLEKK